MDFMDSRAQARGRRWMRMAGAWGKCAARQWKGDGWRESLRRFRGERRQASESTKRFPPLSVDVRDASESPIWRVNLLASPALAESRKQG